MGTQQLAIFDIAPNTGYIIKCVVIHGTTNIEVGIRKWVPYEYFNFMQFYSRKRRLGIITFNQFIPLPLVAFWDFKS